MDKFHLTTNPLLSLVPRLSISHIGITIALLLGGFQISAYLKHRKFIREYGEADYRPAFGPMTALGMLFGLGTRWHWDQRFTMYRNPNKEVISVEPSVWGSPFLYTNSIEVMRQIGGGGSSTTWIKPPWSSVSFLYWGNNVLAVNGAEWRKHRRILQPSFNPKAYETVWSETTRLYNEMIASSTLPWPTQPEETISFESVLTITHRVALCVILSCGFGLPLAWDEKAYADERAGGISLDEGIRIQGDNMIFVLFAPKWIQNLPFKSLQRIKQGIAAMRHWFNSNIEKKKKEIVQVLKDTDGDIESEGLKKDAFSRLTLASQLDSKLHFEDSDVIGNTWVMFFAGHDTTASAIAATLCMLAYHTHEQDIVYEEIRSILGSNNGQIIFEQFEALVKTRSAFVEAVRMFPSGSILIRESTEDTKISIPTTGEDGSVYDKITPIPKGTVLIGDMVGMQYNPRTFPSPEVYKPSRWYNTTTDDAYTVFSIGPRTCIGRRFALTEAVAFISNLLRDYSVEPLLKDGESMEHWKERVLGRTTVKLTLSIVEAPLRFKRR